MPLIENAKAAFNIGVSLTAITSTFFTVIELMGFLSDPYFKTQRTARDNFWISATRSLLVDQLLLSAFVAQHSVLAHPNVKRWMASLKLEVLQRSVYVITTCLTLQLILKCWQPVPEVVLWNVDTNVKLYWWAFLTAHLLAWTVIYVGTICMDVNELLGIKQVYYNFQNLSDPNVYKSRELKQLYAHMRHPSFVGFLVVFWMVPFMSLDRLLLAVLWSAYMYLTWNTDQSDYRYQQGQFVKKFHELYYVKT